MSYYRAPAGLRKTEVTEYDEMILGKIAGFLLQLIAQLTFEGCSSARARGERQSTYLGYPVLMVRTYALERLLGVIDGEPCDLSLFCDDKTGRMKF